MANPPTDGCAKAEIRFTLNGQQAENVINWQHALGDVDATTLQALAEGIAAVVTSDWLPLMAATCIFREVYVEAYGGPISLTHTTSGANAVGTAEGNAMPGGSTFCLSLRTGFAGRSKRGRMYTLGMTEEQQNAGIVTSTYRNGWLAAWGALQAALVSDNWFPVVLSKVVDGETLPFGDPTPITAVIAVDDFVDSQRRRLQGRGA